MSRFTFHVDSDIADRLITPLYCRLFDVIHASDAPTEDAVVEHVHTDTRSCHRRIDHEYPFHSEPFIEYNGEHRYIPSILETMAKLKFFEDFEAPQLGALFITKRELRTNYWQEPLREKLLRKSFLARHLDIFLLRNLELFLSATSLDTKYKQKILREAVTVSEDNIDRTIPTDALIRIISGKEIIQGSFMKALTNDLNQLAILAEIG